MIKILEGSSIFIKQPNGAILQITGSPISEIDAISSQTIATINKIQRYRIFYCNPLKANYSILMTLPRKRTVQNLTYLLTILDVLNCKIAELDELNKKIFYRDCKMDRLFPKLKEYAMEIRKRHRKCPYERIFDYHCPLPPSTQNNGFDVDGFVTQSEDEELPAPKRRKGVRRSARIQISPGTYTLSYALKYFDVSNSTFNIAPYLVGLLFYQKNTSVYSSKRFANSILFEATVEETVDLH